jgi:hypothetical protein
LDNRVKGWKDCPEKQMLLAEINYRIARRGSSSKEALRATRRYLNRLTYPDFAMAADSALLDSIVGFLIDESLNEASIVLKSSRVNRYTGYLNYSRKYIKLRLGKWDKECKDEFLGTYGERFEVDCDFWVKRDQDFIKLCLLQACGDINGARKYLSSFERLDNNYYYGLELLRARQERLEGNLELARKLYKPLLNKYPKALDEFNF